MGILKRISSPADIRRLSDQQLAELADEIRQFLVEKVSATGGHLGPNLGVVELTLALHRVFDSPYEPIIFDTSHQSYVHKIITGRAAGFDQLRQKGGLSGYTSRSESEHDWTESSHASAALSYADGLSKAYSIQDKLKAKEAEGGQIEVQDTAEDNRRASSRAKGSERFRPTIPLPGRLAAANNDKPQERNVVAVVGDGALTGGMCWEALNNIATGDRNVVIVVNDNGRSYSPTIGGFAENLARLRMQSFYDRVMEQGKSTLNSMGWVGKRTFEALHAFKEGVKSTVIPTEMFPELGMKYVGPVDGHDLEALHEAFTYARDYDGPVIVHAVTEKGRGFAPAENDTAELMHSTGIIDPVTGEPKSTSRPGWTALFSEELIKAGEKREDIVAITAAMSGPTGLAPFAEKFPERFFDVGIAEAHALTSAAGLALGGMHPVVALYSTFLNRAFDQLLMDVALLDQPVTLVLDRSGVTGSDGASHNGVWDLSLVSTVPGARIAAPRDGERLAELFNEAINIEDGPTVVRFPKGDRPDPIPAIDNHAGLDILHRETAEDDDAPKVLIISIGALSESCLSAATTLAEDCAVTVVDPRWVAPINPGLIELSADFDLIITVEDGVIRGGIGSLIAEALAATDLDIPIRHCGFPSYFPEHAGRGELLSEIGLTPEGIVETVRTALEEISEAR